MKITKRQLRRIIKEERAKLKEYGGRPYDPTVSGDQSRSLTGDAPPGSEFDAKLEKMADEIGDRAAGGYEPSIDGSPEAYADHILDVYLQNPPPPLDKMEDLEFVLKTPMYREQVKNAVLEYIGMMTEGRTLREQYHSMSPAGKSLANSIKGKFMRMYPDAKVGVDGRGGFITVNGIKAIDMSQATGRGMSDEEMIDKMHAVYAQTHIDPDIPTADTRMDTFREGKKMKITKRQLRRIIKEEKTKLIKERSRASSEGELIADLASIRDAIEEISTGMYGLVDPDGYAASGDEMAEELMLHVNRLDAFYNRLNAYFKTVDDLAGRNPGGSIG